MPKNLTAAERTRLLDLSLADGDLMALLTVAGSDSAAGTEVVGGTYARQVLDWAAAADGTKANAAAVTFSGVPDVDVNAWAIYDSTGTTRKWYGTFADAPIRASSITLPAGELVVSLDPAPVVVQTWDPATMLGADQLHPNDVGSTYIADSYEAALADAGRTPAPGTTMTAYGDSWTALDEENTPALRAVHQLRDRLGVTLVNNAVGASRSEDIAERATATFNPGTGALVLVGNAGLNDLVDADTTVRRAASTEALRALVAVLSAAERIEQTAMTLSTGWSSGSNPGVSGGTAVFTSTNGATATATIATAGTYYLLTHGTRAADFTGGLLTISQGGTTLATKDVHDLSVTKSAGPVAVRIPNVQAGDLTITFSTNGRAGTVYGWVDALVRVAAAPPTVLFAKPVEVLMAMYVKPALLAHIRDAYDSLAAEFGPHVVVCDPDPDWTP